MIAYLSGVALTSDTILTEGGVGYLVHTIADLEEGQQVTLWIHTQTAENGTTLYGFSDKTQRDLFTALLKTPGVGGRTAADIVASGTVPHIVGRIDAEDVTFLSSVKCIGPAKAKKLLATIKLPPTLPRENGEPPHMGPNRVARADDIAAAASDLTGADYTLCETAAATARAAHPDSDEATLLRATLAELKRTAHA